MAAPAPPSEVTSATTSGAPSAASSTSTVPQTDDGPEKIPDDGSKLKMFLGILRKFIGVADIASVRFSLPSQLLEPRPNLEYWTYLDRPEYFVAIGDSDEPLDRMVEVLRFWFTKDLKYVKGKPCKPYNSALGEFFRCNWDITETAPPINSLRPSTASSSKAPSISSLKSTPLHSRAASTSATPIPDKLAEPIKVSYLTEQTSHHPPVSAFQVSCPAKGLTARGFDQISAKFTGTSIKVTPGDHNSGIFINLEKRDNEQYQLTHPAAYLGGLLRGALTVTVFDYCYVTCPKTKMKAILQYIEEGWLGRAQNKVEGIVFTYDPENDDKVRLKDVPEADILMRVGGNWKEKLFFSTGPRSEPTQLLLDLTPLAVAPKNVPPLAQQLSNESLKFWDGVTVAIANKQFSKATNVKVAIEEKQRVKAKARETNGEEWNPRFFQSASESKYGKDAKLWPDLNGEGERVIGAALEGNWDIFTDSEKEDV